MLNCFIRGALRVRGRMATYRETEAGKNYSIDIGGMRSKYKTKKEAFTENDLVAREPVKQFKAWFEEACQIPEIIEANAMCLATSSKDGIPSARYVLLKGYGSDGFKFFTNYSSFKGQQLAENPVAALVFYWEPLKRSVRISGTVKKLDASVSDEYFHSRPKASQIGASISEQSRVIANREVLVERERKMNDEFAADDAEIPRPENWGGYIVKPDWMEFWQGQSDRIHDRIRFRYPQAEEKVDNVQLHQGEDGWVFERLSP